MKKIIASYISGEFTFQQALQLLVAKGLTGSEATTALRDAAAKSPPPPPTPTAGNVRSVIKPKGGNVKQPAPPKPSALRAK